MSCLTKKDEIGTNQKKKEKKVETS